MAELSCMVYIWSRHNRPEEEFIRNPDNTKTPIHGYHFDKSGNSRNVYDASNQLVDPKRQKFRLEHLKGVGHASIDIIDRNNKHMYITWFPEGAIDSHGRAPVYGQIFKVTLQSDGAQYGGVAAARKYRLNASKLGEAKNGQLLGQTNPFGVDINLMHKFWQSVCELPDGHNNKIYSQRSKDQNCAGMVVRALCAGRADLFSTKKPKNIIYQGITTLTTWLEDLQPNIDRINDYWNKYTTQPITVAGKPIYLTQEILNVRSIGADYIPTRQQFVKESSAGLLARRHGQILAIDRLLDLYPQTQDPLDKLRILMAIMVRAVSHLEAKPMSDRRMFIIKLLARVIAVIDKQPLEFTESSSSASSMRKMLVDGASPQILITNTSLSSSIEEETRQSWSDVGE